MATAWRSHSSPRSRRSSHPASRSDCSIWISPETPQPQSAWPSSTPSSECRCLLASAFASTEFQAVQFMPAFILPQLVLCGLFAPRDSMASVLAATSDALPMTYAFDELQEVAESSSITNALIVDAGVTAGVIVLALTPRRRNPAPPDHLATTPIARRTSGSRSSRNLFLTNRVCKTIKTYGTA
jgi:ABC-2 type transporter